jgi:hypothetical protein
MIGTHLSLLSFAMISGASRKLFFSFIYSVVLLGWSSWKRGKWDLKKGAVGPFALQANIAPSRGVKVSDSFPQATCLNLFCCFDLPACFTHVLLFRIVTYFSLYEQMHNGINMVADIRTSPSA